MRIFKYELTICIQLADNQYNKKVWHALWNNPKRQINFYEHLFKTQQSHYLIQKMKTRKSLFTTKKIALTTLLMAFGFGLFASPGKGDQKLKKNKRETTRTLSADESALYENVEAFYHKNYTKVVDETVNEEIVSKVVVYDMAGTVLQEQAAKVTKIDLAKLPANAKILMQENGVHYYIVL